MEATVEARGGGGARADEVWGLALFGGGIRMIEGCWSRRIIKCCDQFIAV